MNRFAACGLVALLGAVASCGTGSPVGDEMTGTATVAITAAPPDGTCIQITAQGVRTVTKQADVPVGQSTVFHLSSLPLNTVIFGANAFTGPCSMVGASTVPNWVSDPVTATVAVAPPVNVTLEMHRNGNANVGVDFPNEPADGGPPDATVVDSSSGPPDTGAPPPPVCGNGVIETGEQCDDGNRLDLDGCDSSCKYEVVTRFTSLAFSASAAPAACTPATNAVGTRLFTSTALGQLNPSLQTDVNNGVINAMVQFLGLTDLTGQNATGLSLGFASASLDPSRGTFPAGNPIDWSFLADPSTVSLGLPTATMPTQIASGNVAGGPGTAALALSLAGSPTTLTLQQAHVFASVNASPAPDAPAPPPSQLAAGLVVFQTITATAAGQGLCGNVGVSTLAQVPVPQALASGGATACSRNYTFCGAGMPVGPTCNSLLDVFVGGCAAGPGGLIPVFNATQPDVGLNGAPPTTLAIGANNKVALTSADLNDAYSSAFTFAANRAHFTGETCQTTSQCQVGQTCTAGVCH